MEAPLKTIFKFFINVVVDMLLIFVMSDLNGDMYSLVAWGFQISDFIIYSTFFFVLKSKSDIASSQKIE